MVNRKRGGAVVWRAMAVAAFPVAAGLVAVTELSAQPVNVTLRAGTTQPSGAYQRGCGQISTVIGVEVRGSGYVFPWAAVDRYSVLGGGDVACVVGMSEPSTGGLSMAATTSLAGGVGLRSARGPLQFDGTLGVGFLRGAPGHGPDTTRLTRPTVGIATGVILFHHIVLSVEKYWARLDYGAPTGATGVQLDPRWAGNSVLRLGVRLP